MSGWRKSLGPDHVRPCRMRVIRRGNNCGNVSKHGKRRCYLDEAKPMCLPAPEGETR